jgi:RNA polymerase sigma factor (sigma-70 family)
MRKIDPIKDDLKKLELFVNAGSTEKERAEAFAFVYKKYYAVLVRMIQRYSDTFREDIAQDAFYYLLKNPKQYRGDGTLLAWLSKVSYHIFLQYKTRYQQETYYANQDIVFEKEESTDMPFAAVLWISEMFKGILTERERSIFEDRYQYNLSIKQLVRKYRISKINAYVILFRIRKKARKSLG